MGHIRACSYIFACLIKIVMLTTTCYSAMQSDVASSFGQLLALTFDASFTVGLIFSFLSCTFDCFLFNSRNTTLCIMSIHFLKKVCVSLKVSLCWPQTADAKYRNVPRFVGNKLKSAEMAIA